MVFCNEVKASSFHHKIFALEFPLSILGVKPLIFTKAGNVGLTRHK